MIIRRSTVQISLDVLRIGTKYMNKKTLALVALSLSVCAGIYASEPLAVSWTAASPIVLRGNRGVLVMGGLTSHSATTDSVDIFKLL